ncbi:MAG: DUF1292 domain-containing protein [Lachnospiraceae bacterium]|nr:DUF1292 domain-containing protein [Lachnospiraceae bacterium]MBR1524984.1 DUF1292 domain-containing protein [Lachnospiraceae bacterium]
MNSIEFTDEENNTALYEVIETTTLGGNTYLLVADTEDNAFILKEQFSAGDEETAAYTDELTDSERDAVAAVFNQLLDEADIALEF